MIATTFALSRPASRPSGSRATLMTLLMLVLIACYLSDCRYAQRFIVHIKRLPVHHQHLGLFVDHYAALGANLEYCAVDAHNGLRAAESHHHVHLDLMARIILTPHQIAQIRYNAGPQDGQTVTALQLDARLPGRDVRVFARKLKAVSAVKVYGTRLAPDVVIIHHLGLAIVALTARQPYGRAKRTDGHLGIIQIL